MDDYLVKATTSDGMFRAYAVNAKKLVATAQKIMIPGAHHQLLWVGLWLEQ